jgi:hypothetical protein
MKDVETLILKKIELELGNIVSNSMKEGMSFKQYVDFESGLIKTQFRAYILGREVKVETKELMKCYTSWWQFFKAEHMPDWFNIKFPIRINYVPIVIHHIHVCPHINYEGNKGDEIHFAFLRGINET